MQGQDANLIHLTQNQSWFRIRGIPEAQHRVGFTCKGARNHMSLLCDPRGRPMEAPANIPGVLRTFPSEFSLSRCPDPLQGSRGGPRARRIPGSHTFYQIPKASLQSGHPVQHLLPSGAGRLPVWAPVFPETAHESLGKSPVSPQERTHKVTTVPPSLTLIHFPQPPRS